MACYSLTGHGLDRMEERRISHEEIHEALANQYQERPGKKPHQRVHLGFTDSGRRLKIVLAYDDEPPVLVTVSAVDE